MWYFLAIVFALLLCWWAWDRQQGEAELQAVLLKWDQQGPWRWDDWLAARPHPADEDNGALVMNRMSQLKPKNLESELSQYLFTADPEYHPQRLYHSEQLRELKDRVTPCKEMLALFPEYAGKKTVVWPIAGKPSPFSYPFDGIDRSREVLNVLLDQFIVDVHDGKNQAACQQILNGLLLTRNMDHHLTWLGHLVQISFLGRTISSIQTWLALSEPEDGLLVLLQKELAHYDDTSRWKKSLLTEAGGMDQSIRELREGKVDVNRLWGGGGNGISWWEDQWIRIKEYFLSRGLLTARQHAECLELMLACYLQADQPWSVQLKAWKVVDERLKKELTAVNRRMSHLMLPALVKVMEAEVQMIAGLRAARIVLAAERFRKVEKRWPASQVELVGRYLDAVLLDPFDDQPMRMKRVEDGLIIYSVDKNLVDDQGVVLRTEAAYSPLDVGIKLWDVKHRRQPARPLPKEYLERRDELKRQSDESQSGNIPHP